MYDSIPDPYCYPGTAVVKNRANIRDQAELNAFEHEAMLQRAEEPYPAGRLSASHFKAIHRHLFQDVYTWAVGSTLYASARAAACSATLSTSGRRCTGRSISLSTTTT